jgi:hypothetical protein
LKSIDVYALGKKYFEKVKRDSISKIYIVITLKAISSVVFEAIGLPPDCNCIPRMSKRTSYGKIYRSDVRTRPRLPRGRVFTARADGKQTRPRGLALSPPHPAPSPIPPSRTG